MPSKARTAFDANVQDIDKLLEFHAAGGGDQPGRRYGLEVLNKSSIVLITSFWESYCEDLAEEALEVIVEHAPNADALPKEIKKVIAKALKEDKNELAIWRISDDKWRDVLRMNFVELKTERNKTFATPKSFNVNHLFESALGLSDMSSNWKWERMTAVQAAKKLNEFVSMRGDIAHRGSSTSTVKKSQVVDYLKHVKMLAAKTGGAVKKHVKAITGQDLW
ncbi:MAE_28990/MAE_18760 family HEPN-like nuclease [Burkholderia cepacia]|nr:MAE_28990/MAE_18760 family HEPN-like nuclease [Burkholderia cepacia]